MAGEVDIISVMFHDSNSGDDEDFSCLAAITGFCARLGVDNSCFPLVLVLCRKLAVFGRLFCAIQHHLALSDSAEC